MRFLANKEVEKAVSKEANSGKKRGIKYSAWRLHCFDDPLEVSDKIYFIPCVCLI